MTEKDKAEIRKLNEEVKTLKHDRWIKRRELKLKSEEVKLKWYAAAITTLIGSAGIFKIIKEFLPQ